MTAGGCAAGACAAGASGARGAGAPICGALTCGARTSGISGILGSGAGAAAGRCSCKPVSTEASRSTSRSSVSWTASSVSCVRWSLSA